MGLQAGRIYCEYSSNINMNRDARGDTGIIRDKEMGGRIRSSGLSSFGSGISTTRRPFALCHSLMRMMGVLSLSITVDTCGYPASVDLQEVRSPGTAGGAGHTCSGINAFLIAYSPVVTLPPICQGPFHLDEHGVK